MKSVSPPPSGKNAHKKASAASPNDSSTTAPIFRMLLGTSGSDALNEGVLHRKVIASYRLRVVAVGALITVCALINMSIYVLLRGAVRESQIAVNGYLVVMFLGLFTLSGIVLTPWRKLFLTKWGLPVLYGWSVFGICVVGTAIYYDGGGSSPLVATFFVMTVFFAIAYSQRAQALLYLLTVAIYSIALSLRGWNTTAADFTTSIAALGLTAYVASLLSSWLVTEMRDRARSSTTAEQRAGMLDTVARAARRVSSLDASHVLGGALAGAMELGCYEAEIWMVGEERSALQLQRRLAIDPESPHEELAQKLFTRARVSGTTQIVAVEADRVVACLLHREGEAAGLLLTRMSEADSGDSLIIECIELLAAQVSAGLDVARNVAERRGLEERLAHWAFHDSLTDLPNRVLFADRLELALARIARDSSYVAVLFLDLDGFKGINDSLGHAAGDELLHGVAVRLHGCLRPNDTLARYGGDEFVVLVEQIDGPEAAIRVADRILEALQRPVRVGGTDLVVRTSIGIALTQGTVGGESDVLRRADMAMYQAKADGGSSYVLSMPPEPGDAGASVAREAS